MSTGSGESVQWRRIRAAAMYQATLQARGVSLPHQCAFSPRFQSAGTAQTRHEMPSSSSAALLDAYIAMQHCREQQDRRSARHYAATSRRSNQVQRPCDRIANAVAPYPQSAQPDSPLSRFKRQAAQLSWKRTNLKERENMDTNRGSTNYSISPDAEPINNVSAEMTKYGDQSTAVDHSRLHASSTSRAVWEKIQDAKQIQRWTHHHNVPKYSLVRQRSREGAQSTLSDEDEFDDTEILGNVNRATTVGFAAACAAVSPVSVVPPVPHTKPVKPLVLLPSHNALTTTVAGEGNKLEQPTTISVDEVVRLTQAAYCIQIAWRQYKKQHDPSSANGTSQRTDNGTCIETINAKYIGNGPNDQPNSPQLPRPLVTAKKLNDRRVKAGEIETTTEISAQINEDISLLERWNGELVGMEHPQPLGTLWTEDDWVSLEEGLYLGGQRNERHQHSSSLDELLLWKHPHTLIQIRENQRLEALRTQRQRRVDTSADTAITTNKSQQHDEIDAAIVPISNDEKCESNLAQNAKTSSPISSFIHQIPLLKVCIRSRRRRAKPSTITCRRRARKRSADCIIGSHGQSNVLQAQLVVNSNDQSERDADGSSSVLDKSCETVEINYERVDGTSVAAHDALTTPYVVFSSPKTQEDSEESSSRNDLISIGDLTVAGDLLRTMSTHARSSTESVSRFRRDQPNVNGFIPLDMAALGCMSDDYIEATTSAHDDGHFIETASYYDDFCDGVDAKHSSAENYILDVVERFSTSEFSGTASAVSQHDEHSLRLNHVSNGEDCYQSTKCASTVPVQFDSANHAERHEHAVAENVLNDGPGDTLNLLKQLEQKASTVVQRMRQKYKMHPRFESKQFAEMTNPLKPHRAMKLHAVDEAKQQEFRQILDEFKVSLQQSTGSSSSPSSLPLLLPATKLERSEVTEIYKDATTLGSNQMETEEETREIDREEMEDEQLQSMLQEIYHFKQQFEKMKIAQ